MINNELIITQDEMVKAIRVLVPNKYSTFILEHEQNPRKLVIELPINLWGLDIEVIVKPGSPSDMAASLQEDII